MKSGITENQAVLYEAYKAYIDAKVEGSGLERGDIIKKTLLDPAFHYAYLVHVVVIYNDNDIPECRRQMEEHGPHVWRQLVSLHEAGTSGQGNTTTNTNSEGTLTNFHRRCHPPANNATQKRQRLQVPRQCSQSPGQPVVLENSTNIDSDAVLLPQRFVVDMQRKMTDMQRELRDLQSSQGSVVGNPSVLATTSPLTTTQHAQAASQESQPLRPVPDPSADVIVQIASLVNALKACREKTCMGPHCRGKVKYGNFCRVCFIRYSVDELALWKLFLEKQDDMCCFLRGDGAIYAAALAPRVATAMCQFLEHQFGVDKHGCLKVGSNPKKRGLVWQKPWAKTARDYFKKSKRKANNFPMDMELVVLHGTTTTIENWWAMPERVDEGDESPWVVRGCELMPNGAAEVYAFVTYYDLFYFWASSASRLSFFHKLPFNIFEMDSHDFTGQCVGNHKLMLKSQSDTKATGLLQVKNYAFSATAECGVTATLKWVETETIRCRRFYKEV